jgi:glycosyltransferase involved in cell wall biosynthesis
MVTMNKLNILHLTYDMGIGGTEQVIRNLVDHTDLERFNPSVICLDNNVGPLGIKLREQGFEVTAFKRQPGLDFNLIKTIRQHIKNKQIDILHCHQYTPYSYGLLASWFTNIKVIFTEHGRFYPDRFKWKRMLVNPIFSLKTASIISISKSTKEALVKYEFFPKNQIEVIYNGINDLKLPEFDETQLRESLGISADAPILGTISRLDPIKNQIMMLDAFKEIHKKLPQTKLLIVGDGPLRETLESHAKSLGLESDTIFTGFQIDPQKYLKLMDIFLLPSLSEGTSMTLLEAMSYHKPCVVTDAGGNPEIVSDGETGFVTPNRDMPAFVTGIFKLLNNKELKNRMGNSARERYENYFTVDKMTTLYQELYLRTHQQ